MEVYPLISAWMINEANQAGILTGFVVSHDLGPTRFEWIGIVQKASIVPIENISALCLV